MNYYALMKRRGIIIINIDQMKHIFETANLPSFLTYLSIIASGIKMKSMALKMLVGISCSTGRLPRNGSGFDHLLTKNIKDMWLIPM